MSELHGGKMPGSMNEMLNRLEAGEDPEKLDAQYGEELEGCDLFGEESGEENGRSHGGGRRAVLRDPTLYEMAEYVG
jgi:hypothetical protein